MPTFIIASLALGFLVQTDSPYQELFKSMELFYLGVGCILLSAITGLNERVSSSFSYDSFSLGTLLVWFSYWHQLYRDDAPMFYIFPFYFALITSIVLLLLVNRRHLFDDESLEYIRFYSRMGSFNTGLIVSAVLVSLLMTDHVLIYPISMTVLILRFVLSVCQEPISTKND